MHAIYSVTSGSRPRPGRSVKRSSADKDELDFGTSLTSHGLSELDSKFARRLYRRSADDENQIGVSGQGTNIRMIRLLFEPAESSRNTSSSKGLEQQTESNEARDTSLVNPLVIGIAGVCVLLLVALVVVGVLFRRKLLTQQSQNAPPVETKSREVTMSKTEGEAV